jgi:multidrug efflux system outer membrane protein
MSAALVMSACTMVPQYHRPDASVAPTYATSAATSDSSATADIAWRAFYTEPNLQNLIELALANNRDLRVSILNVEAARAQYQIQRADLLPTLSATAGGTVQRLPADLSMTGQSGVTHSYSVGGAIASYELDLFGRMRSLSESALQSYLATDEARKAAQISLVSEVANTWLTLQADLQLRKLTADTLLNQQASYKIVKAGFEAGTSSAVDVSQAETQVRSAEANLAQYDRQAKQDINALTLLVGVPVPAHFVVAMPLDNIKLDDGLAAGLPSGLLTRRPDIVAAEHQLKAANANIGAARAAFFPRIALTATGGTASASLSGLFDPGSSAWSFGPSISVPIFDYGRNKANLDVAKVATKIEVANYQKAIQTAFREVSDALAGRDTYARQGLAQTGLVDASAKAYRLSNARYQQGIDGYLNVLINQRSLYDAQQNLVKVELERAQNSVGLYRALGGGWNDDAADGSTAPNAMVTPSVTRYDPVSAN